MEGSSTIQAASIRESGLPINPTSASVSKVNRGIKIPLLPLSKSPPEKSSRLPTSPRDRRAITPRGKKEEGNGIRRKKRSRSLSRHHVSVIGEKEIPKDDKPTISNPALLSLPPRLLSGDHLKKVLNPKNLTIEYQSDKECKSFNARLVELLEESVLENKLLPLEEIIQKNREFWPESLARELFDIDLLEIFQRSLLSRSIQQAIAFQEVVSDYKSKEKKGSPLSNAIASLFENLIKEPSVEKKTIEKCEFCFFEFLMIREVLKSEVFNPVRKSLKRLIPYKKKRIWQEILKSWVAQLPTTLEDPEGLRQGTRNIHPKNVYRSIIPEGQRVYLDVNINGQLLYQDMQAESAYNVFRGMLNVIYQNRTDEYFYSVFGEDAEIEVVIDHQIKIFLLLSSEKPEDVKIQKEVENYLVDQDWHRLEIYFKLHFKCINIDWELLKKKFQSIDNPSNPIVELMHLIMPAFEILQTFSISNAEPYREIALNEFAKMGIDSLTARCISASDSDYKTHFSVQVDKTVYTFERILQIGIYPKIEEGGWARLDEKMATFNLRIVVHSPIYQPYEPHLICENLTFTKVRETNRHNENINYTSALLEMISKLSKTRLFPRAIFISSKEVTNRKIEGLQQNEN